MQNCLFIVNQIATAISDSAFYRITLVLVYSADCTKHGNTVRSSRCRKNWRHVLRERVSPDSAL